MTGAAGSDDATKEGSISIIAMIGVAIEGPGTCRYRGVGCPINSLKEAPRLLETEVSGSRSDNVCAGVKPIWSGVNYRATTGEANH